MKTKYENVLGGVCKKMKGVVGGKMQGGVENMPQVTINGVLIG